MPTYGGPRSDGVDSWEPVSRMTSEAASFKRDEFACGADFWPMVPPEHNA